MEQDKLDDEFVKNFNIGYIFGNNFPYISEEFFKTNKPEVERNMEDDNFKPITGIVLGLQQFYNEKNKDLQISKSNQLDELREIREKNQDNRDLDRDI